MTKRIMNKEESNTNRGRSRLSGLLAVMLCLALAFSFAACKDDTPSEKEDADKTPKEESTIKDYDLKLYFANMEYIEMGDETKKHLVGPFDYKIEDVEDGEQYMMLLDLLNKSDSYENAYSSTKAIKFVKVTVDGDTATVDIDKNASNLDGGSLDELLLIEQVVTSLVDSFDNINQVQFLLDGEKVDSLMGHMDVSIPLTKADLSGIKASDSAAEEEDR